MVEVKPKRQRKSSTPEGHDCESKPNQTQQKVLSPTGSTKDLEKLAEDNPVKSLVAAYESSEDED